MAQWQVSLVDGLMDFSFSILIALFYASVLSARYGKTNFRVIVSAVMIIATIITNIIHMPQMPMFFTGIAILMTFKKNIIHFYSICIGYFIVARISFTANNTNAKL